MVKAIVKLVGMFENEAEARVAAAAYNEPEMLVEVKYNGMMYNEGWEVWALNERAREEAAARAEWF